MSDSIIISGEPIRRKLTFKDYLDEKLKRGEFDTALLERIDALRSENEQLTIVNSELLNQFNEGVKANSDLRAENERYKTALEEIDYIGSNSSCHECNNGSKCGRIAQSALNGGK